MGGTTLASAEAEILPFCFADIEDASLLSVLAVLLCNPRRLGVGWFPSAGTGAGLDGVRESSLALLEFGGRALGGEGVVGVVAWLSGTGVVLISVGDGTAVDGTMVGGEKDMSGSTETISGIPAGIFGDKTFF